MKRKSYILKVFSLALAALALSLAPMPAFPPEPGNSAIFQVGSDRCIINGLEQPMETIVFTEDRHIFVPLRHLAYSLGLTDENIIWDGKDKKITLFKEDATLSLQVGGSKIEANGMPLDMETAPQMLGGRVFLPARRVAEFFGYTVEWDAKSNSLLIYLTDSHKPEPPAGKVKILLVNRSTPLPAGYRPKQLASIGNNQLSPELLPFLQELFDSAGVEGFTLSVNSGYRSAGEQEYLYKKAVSTLGPKAAADTTAPPGYSEHHTGLAVDIKGTPAAYAWLEKNSWRNGFILRYPRGKKSVTGYSFEPWHYRYVGKPVASFMHYKNIATLEEYITGINLQSK